MPAIQEYLIHYAGDPRRLLDALSVETDENRKENAKSYRAEYNGERLRRPTSVGNRPMRLVPTFSETELDEKGAPILTGSQRVEAIKIATNFPQKIVRTEVAFLFGGTMRVETQEPDDAFATFVDTWEQTLGMQDILIEFAEKVLSETKAAIIFYPIHNPRLNKTEINCRVLSLPKTDDAINEFYPHFDDTGRMDAFLYRYQVKDIENKTREEAKLWTADRLYTFTQGLVGVWDIQEEINLFGLIPVVYTEIDKPIWDPVAPVMDAFEQRTSRIAETNNYMADPMIVVHGEIDAPFRDQAGKVLVFPTTETSTGSPTHGDAKVLSWNQETASTSKELDLLRAEMYSGVSVPDLSFESLRGIGNMSGVARRFMLIDTKIKELFNQRYFRPALKRCVTVVKAGLYNIVDIKLKATMEGARYSVKFDSILPKDPAEEANVLSIAGGGKPFNSRQTIVARSPFTPPGEAEAELERIKQDEEEAARADNLIGPTVSE